AGGTSAGRYMVHHHWEQHPLPTLRSTRWFVHVIDLEGFVRHEQDCYVAGRTKDECISGVPRGAENGGRRPRQAVGLASTARFAAGLTLGLATALMGISRTVILLPSIAGGRSTLPTPTSPASTASSTRRPSS